MNYLVKNNNFVEQKKISTKEIEHLRSNTIDFFKTYKPSELNEFDDEVKSLISILDINHDIRDDETFLSGYLWACNDIVDSMFDNTKENEKTRLLREDKLLLEVIEFFRGGGSFSNNAIAQKLSKSQGTISKLMNRHDLKKLDLFVCEKIKHKKYYSLSPKGRNLYLTYRKKLEQESQFNKLAGEKRDFYSCQTALAPTRKTLDYVLFEDENIKSYEDKTMFKNIDIAIDKNEFVTVIKNRIGFEYELE